MTTFIVKPDPSLEQAAAITNIGQTYHFAEGHPNHDLVQHFLNGPDGLFVETGVFLDFQSSDPGDRLNLQAVFLMVIDPNGKVRLDGVNKGVLVQGNCAP